MSIWVSLGNRNESVPLWDCLESWVRSERCEPRRRAGEDDRRCSLVAILGRQHVPRHCETLLRGFLTPQAAPMMFNDSGEEGAGQQGRGTKTNAA